MTPLLINQFVKRPNSLIKTTKRQHHVIMPSHQPGHDSSDAGRNGVITLNQSINIFVLFNIHRYRQICDIDCNKFSGWSWPSCLVRGIQTFDLRLHPCRLTHARVRPHYHP